MDSPAAQPLAGTEGALGPFFSPDGQWIAFFAAGSLKKVPVPPAALSALSPKKRRSASAAHGRQTTRSSSRQAMPPSSGVSRPTAANRSRSQRSIPAGENSAIGGPKSSPTASRSSSPWVPEGGWVDAVIAVQTIGANDRRTVVQGGTSPRLSSSGHLLYTRGGVLYSRPFDGRREESGGQPVPKGGPDRRVERRRRPVQYLARRHTGVRARVLRPERPDARLGGPRWMPPQPLAAPPHAFSDPRLSPDGRMIAMTIVGASSDVCTYEIAGNRLSQFTFDGGKLAHLECGRPAHRLRRKPRRIARPFLEAERPERSRRTTDPYTTRGGTRRPGPRDRGIIFAESDADGRDIAWLLPDRSVRPVLSTPAHEGAPAALARRPRPRICLRPVRASAEVYVALLADPTRGTQVSTGGGSEPVWRKDGTELVLPLGHADAGRRCPHAAVAHPAGRATFVQRTIRDRRGLAAWVRYQPGRNAIPDGPRAGATRAGTRAPDLSRLETRVDSVPRIHCPIISPHAIASLCRRSPRPL